MSEHLVIDQDIEAFIDIQFKALADYDKKRNSGRPHPYEFDKHSVRVANDMRALARLRGMSEDQADLLYRLTLVHDIGKRSFPAEIWDMEDKPSAEVKAQRRAHTTAGVTIVDDHFGADDRRPAVVLMRDLIQNHHECVDGTGWLKLPADQLSQEVRMLAICDSFDGMSEKRPHFDEKRDLSPKGVIERMTSEKNGQFDAAILTVFASMKTSQPSLAANKRRPKGLNANI